MTIYYNSTSIITPADYSHLPFLEDLEYGVSTSYCEAYVINLDSSVERLKSASTQLMDAGIKFTRFPAVNGYLSKIKNLETNEEVTGLHLKQTGLKTLPNTPYLITYTSFNEICSANEEPLETEKYEAIYCSKQDLTTSSFKYFGTQGSAGELGIWASNIEIWKKALADGCEDGILVFEDDIVIQEPESFSKQIDEFINNLPNDFDVGFLGYNQVSGQRIAIPGNDKVSAITPDFVAWGMYAAIYSRKGMEKLLNNFETYEKPIDVFMFEQNSYSDSSKLNVYVSEVNMIDAGMHPSTISEMGRDGEVSYYSLNS